MCIIVYKPKNVSLPSREILENCFDYNPDGAGFMIPNKEKVEILKGFETFDAFYKKAVKKITKEEPAVMHFRISTQGGVKPELTHPYALCKDYEEMRKLHNFCNVGIAHNGVISLTSEYSYSTYNYATKKYEKVEPNYNDTMKFIKEYASLIITQEDFYKDSNKLELLSKLCKSKLAILTSDKKVTLIGDFIYDTNSGCYYSNNTYKTQKIVYNDNYKIDSNFWEYYKDGTGLYDFDSTTGFDCPNEYHGYKSKYYCDNCKYNSKCKSLLKYETKTKKDAQ